MFFDLTDENKRRWTKCPAECTLFKGPNMTTDVLEKRPPTNLSYRVSCIPKGLLEVSQEKIMSALEDAGISNDDCGLTILDAPSTTTDDLIDVLRKIAPEIKFLRLKTAVDILKSRPPIVFSDNATETEKERYRHILWG